MNFLKLSSTKKNFHYYFQIKPLKRRRKMHIRPIQEKDNAAIAKIIRENLEYYHLDIPGTAISVLFATKCHLLGSRRK
jgi:hypothetical protein